MQKSETIFWSFVVVAGLYLVADFTAGSRVNAQATQPIQNQAVAANTAPAQGMGCMAKGGGCGCGGMMKKQ